MVDNSVTTFSKTNKCPKMIRLHSMLRRVQLLAVLLSAAFLSTIFSNGISYVNAVESSPLAGYDQGYDLGCYNAKLSDPSIKAPEKTTEDTPFMSGYYDGFTECSETLNAKSRAKGSQSFEEALQPSTSSESLYNTGYNTGCEDAGKPESERYSSQSLELSPDDWVSGYYDGFSSCGGDPAELRVPQPPVTQQPDTRAPSLQGQGIDWIKTCNDLESALISSCDVLVNPDNTLTAEGERAVGCIRNGIALAGGGTLLLSLPLTLVIAALQALEEPTGCGGIVNWDSIGNIGDLKGIIGRLS